MFQNPKRPIKRKSSSFTDHGGKSPTSKLLIIISPFFKLSNVKKYYCQLLGHLNPGLLM